MSLAELKSNNRRGRAVNWVVFCAQLCALALAALASGCNSGGRENPTFTGNSGGGSPTGVIGATVDRRLGVNPVSIDFGNVPVGSSVQQSVRVTNVGNADITVSSVAVSNQAFVVTSAGPFPFTTATLTPGEFLTFSVRFDPQVTGTVTGQFTVVGNASNSPLTLTLSGTGVAVAAGQLSASPSNINFGDVVAGTSLDQMVTLFNGGGTTVVLSSATATGAGFSFTGLTLPMALSAGQSVSFAARFAPTATGAAAGMISFVSDAPTSPTQVALSGNGIAPVVTLSAIPASIDFGNVSVGASDSRTVSIANTGNANLTVTAVNATGTGFSATGLTLPLTLIPGESSVFNARFAPTATGSVVGSLSIVSTASNSPSSVALAGNGVAAPSGVLNVSPSAIDFGDAVVGTTATQTVGLTNTGNADLTITSAPVTGAGFSITGLTLPLTLTPGQTSSFTARFAPNAGGAANGSISLVSNASNSPTAVTLSGNGIAQVLTLSVNPTSINFGDVNVGSADTRSVTVTNTGNANVTITAAPVTGTGFSVTGLTLPLTLTPGQASSFTARFAPTATGAAAGSIQLTSNASTAPNTITLNGNGTTVAAGVLTPNPSTVNFGSVIVSNSSSQSVTLTNTGNADLTITAAPVTGAGFSITGLTLPLTLTAGQSSSFSAQFAPGAAGAANGNILFTSNASNSPTSVTLNGTGVAQVLQLTLNPTNINFGDVVTGSKDTRAVTVTNTGNSNVTITAANVTGAGFSTPGLALPLTLTPGQNTSFNVQFAPVLAGAAAGSATLVSNAPAAAVTLAGNGVTPGQLNVNPSSLDFGSIVVGNTDVRSITLMNTGGVAVTVNTANVVGAGFSTTGLVLPLVLNAGQSTAFNAQFAPGVAGAVAGSITIDSTAVNTPNVVTLAGTGVAQVLTASLSPGTIAFGNVNVGATANQTVTLTNTGNFNINVTAANVTGAGFSVVGFVAQTPLAPGQSTTFTARFAPTVTGAAAGSISLTTTATNNPTVTLSGTGTAVPAGVLTLNPTNVNFGSVVVGNTVMQLVSMTNTGTASLTISASNVTGAGFSVTGLTLPLTLAVGQTSSFTAQFAPGAAGVVNGNASFTSNASNSPTSLTLQGTGVAQVLTLSLSPSTINYGNVTTGTQANQTVTMANTGNSNVTVTAINVTGAGFSAVGLTLPVTLTPGQSTTFTARFAPTVAGAANGTISLTSNATNNPTVTLSGTGTVPAIGTLTLNPTNVNFGSVIVGNTVNQSVTMTNTGTASLTITASNVTGAGFSVTGLTLPLTLNVGQSSNFTAQFAPGAAGVVNGSVSLTSNASNSPTSVTLSGTGVAQIRTLSANPTSLNFGNLIVGNSGSQAVTVTNTGNTSVTINSPATVTGAGFSTTGLTLPATLNPGQAINFNVVFQPAAAGAVNGNVTLNSNATNSPTVITLSGTGVAATRTLTVSPASINYGNGILGSTLTQIVTVTNTGNSAVTISMASVVGAAFSFTGLTVPRTVNAGQSITFSALFMPTALGPAAGTLTLTSDATNSPHLIALSGTGIAGVNLAWDASVSTDVTGYEVLRSTTMGGPYSLLNGSLIPGTTFTDSTVVSGTRYFYVARSVNSSGQRSINSNEVTIIP